MTTGPKTANLDLSWVELNISGGKGISDDVYLDRWHVTARVSEDAEDGYAGVKIADFEFVSVPVFECDPLSELDDQSAELSEVAEALFLGIDNDWDIFPSGLRDRYEDLTGDRVLILDSAKVVDEFRGQGVGTIILGHAVKQLSAGVLLVAGIPFPIDKDRGDRETEEGRAHNDAASAKIATAYSRYGQVEHWKDRVWVMRPDQMFNTQLDVLTEAWQAAHPVAAGVGAAQVTPPS
jgi:GNAT superfamily N-acetyltransferase